MGIVNTTPDSFSDGGLFDCEEAAVTHALQLVEDGADILDIGGESTRPGAKSVTIDEEISRTVPVVSALVKKTSVPISIDTRKPEVAVAAVSAGAAIWNDVSALTYEKDSISIAAELACDLVLMHAQGTPADMQSNPKYDNVVTEIYDYLAERITACEKAGINRAKIVIDPGIGFGKTVGHNLKILGNLGVYTKLAPVLLGASRKQFIARLDREGPPDERLGGSLAAALVGSTCGASILRVHDVRQTRQALTIHRAIEENTPSF